ncbi:hypothetical protein [Pedosphaera parvula]|uniref:hypothetical protein n=1 Tax=Pedosphaera parvula TaxID=1032527 RepID=UPI00031C3FAD|nr:hypothetical protein [Pedosphaera parvula]
MTQDKFPANAILLYPIGQLMQVHQPGLDKAERNHPSQIFSLHEEQPSHMIISKCPNYLALKVLACLPVVITAQ